MPASPTARANGKTEIALQLRRSRLSATISWHREIDGVDSMEYKWVTGDGSEVTLTLRKIVPENGGQNAE